MLNVLITGTSNGIGKETAELFLKRKCKVVGLDIVDATISHNNYKHFKVDISKKDKLPVLKSPIDILVNNAGIQTGTIQDIEVNLLGAIYVTERYAHNAMKSILFNASASAHTGQEFPTYAASKGGLISYMKSIAIKYATSRITVNSISCGGVLTDLNKPVLEDRKLWEQIMKVTPMKKWAEPSEIAELIYFMTVTNKSITAQDILVDNGEKDAQDNFVWPNR